MNKEKGQLAKILNILADNEINIRSLNIGETADYGIARLILQDTDRGLAMLKENNIICVVNHVLAAKMPDRPGGLSRLVNALYKADINIVYAYSFLPQERGNAIIIMRIDDDVMSKAEEILSDVDGVIVLDHSTLIMS